ncbi:MAG: hypothetical protein JW928_07675 [Candidatus Aureabacteria bacterium]|nr:hypothetical protein [Candidatus Auribacterota bacterium]
MTFAIILSTLLIVFFIAVFVFLRVLKVRKTEKVLKKYEGKNILRMCPSANFFGLMSRGLAQVRGNGVLILTDEEIFFEMWVPSRQLEIRVSSISKVESVKSFLKKTKLLPFVRVDFKDERGQDDAAAWLVPRTKDWVNDIEKLISRKAGTGDDDYSESNAD